MVGGRENDGVPWLLLAGGLLVCQAAASPVHLCDVGW